MSKHLSRCARITYLNKYILADPEVTANLFPSTFLILRYYIKVLDELLVSSIESSLALKNTLTLITSLDSGAGIHRVGPRSQCPKLYELIHLLKVLE